MGAIKNFNAIDTELLTHTIVCNFQEEVGKNVEWGSDLMFIIKNFVNMVNGDVYESIDPETKKVKKNKVVKGLFIAGGVGSGKTTLVKCLFKAMRDLKISYKTTYEDTNYFFQNKIFQIDDLQREWISSGNLPLEFSTIIIDDCPKENIEFKHMGNTTDLDNFIQYRYILNYTLTFFTSNYPMTKLELDQRTISRLYEMCAYYELRNPDFRKKL